MQRLLSNPITVIDIFAGPGGLGEGFSRFPYSKLGDQPFKISLSIEKDERAHATLKLRSFFRQFPPDRVPAEYYRSLQDLSRPIADRIEELFHKHPAQSKAAAAEAICAELGNPKYQPAIDKSVSNAVKKQKHWVLLGGPPCQAYSLVGRSRNVGNKDYRPQDDARTYLYREYLRIVADHLPSIFVMENVKGLLSATAKNELIFEQIVRDLQNPRGAIGSTVSKRRGVKTTYRLFSVTSRELFAGTRLDDFVVKMECYGVPQARHRLIILGVREDIEVNRLPIALNSSATTTVDDVLADLPRLRSGLSKQSDSLMHWHDHLRGIHSAAWFKGLGPERADIKREICGAIKQALMESLTRGADFTDSSTFFPMALRDWFCDERMTGVLNHETRSHIGQDIERYLFAACFVKARSYSPVLQDFPSALLPQHKNVNRALNGSLFADRFRVQVLDRPSTTVTCHISKDGHYYIHPDPSQYTQIGNAEFGLVS